MNKVHVSIEIASLFFQQVKGTYPGHMADIPYHPTLKSICEVCNVRTETEFGEFCLQIGKLLTEEKQHD